jgi:hypothetical protein
MGDAKAGYRLYILNSMEPHGIYRERNGWGTQHSVRVKYDEHQELDIAEDRYRARGYQPPFDQLPWKDDAANDI